MASKMEETLLNDPIFISNSLKLGLGLLFLTQNQTQSLKSLSTLIKLSNAAVKIPKIVNSSFSLQTIIFTSKALYKSLKVSNLLKSMQITGSTTTSVVSFRHLKAYIGAFNLFRCDEFLNQGCLQGGYKISKNFVKLLEGFVGFELVLCVKQGLDFLGLIVKSLNVVNELSKIHRRSNGVRYDIRFSKKCGMGVESRRLVFDCVYGLNSDILDDSGLVHAKDLEVSISDLLCLSIPIHEMLIPM